MKIKSFALFIILILALTSCKTATTESQKSDIKEIINSPDVTLVDVRIPEQYNESTAEGAINIPLADIENNASGLKDKKVVVFCNKGIQADQAVEILKKNGVDVYDGVTLQNVKAIQHLKN